MKTPPTRVWVPAIVAVAVVIAIAVVGPCGGGQGAGRPNPGGGSTGEPPTWSDSVRAQGDRIADAVLAGGDPEPSLGSVQGTVQTFEGGAPAVAEILSVEVTAEAILLRWRLKSAGPLLKLRPDTLRESPGTDAADVALVDPVAQKQAKPSRFKDRNALRCTCSSVPLSIDAEGQIVTGFYPPLAEETKQVEVRIPGFPPITNVAVTRG